MPSYPRIVSDHSMKHPSENYAELFSTHMMPNGSPRTILPVDTKYTETNSCVIFNGMLHWMMGYNMCRYTLEFRFIGQGVWLGSSFPPVLAYLRLRSPIWDKLRLGKKTKLKCLSETNLKKCIRFSVGSDIPFTSISVKGCSG